MNFPDKSFCIKNLFQSNLSTVILFFFYLFFTSSQGLHSVFHHVWLFLPRSSLFTFAISFVAVECFHLLHFLSFNIPMPIQLAFHNFIHDTCIPHLSWHSILIIHPINLPYSIDVPWHVHFYWSNQWFFFVSQRNSEYVLFRFLIA